MYRQTTRLARFFSCNLLLLLVVALLAACGGSGGNSSSTGTLQPIDLQVLDAGQ
jgi:ABC-type glycerol-3-phosphate transport system substrate-binding protein